MRSPNQTCQLEENPHNETIVIAAALYDPSGELAKGYWSSSVLQLIDILGEINVFLSVYENDSREAGKIALQTLETQVRCNSSVVFEDHLNLQRLQKITIPAGAERVKRIVYLPEARNHALQSLNKPAVQYDKILFMNGVAFDALDALNLLFSTNIDPDNNKKPR